MERISASSPTDKRLISRTEKDVKEQSQKKQMTHLKMGLGPEQGVLKRRKNKWPRMVFLKCSLSFVIRKIQNKTTLRFLLTPARMAKINKITDIKF